MKRYLLFIILIVLGVGSYIIAKEPKQHIANNHHYSAQEKQDIGIFEETKDSVVFISVHQQVVDYWRRDVFNIPKGEGSGFIWNKEGYIVTNHHVIMHAHKAVVTLKNGKKYEAKLVGSAPSYDIAVLKIDSKNEKLDPVHIGTSKGLKVGQSAYAIGNPFGLEWTMTKGIISALEREMSATNGMPIRHMIQTDASINPGNSGGPLLNSEGKVIGVNNMILSPSGANAGIGFSIPIDTVKRVVSSLIKHGTYKRPSIGINVDTRVNALYKRYYKKSGVVVIDVLSKNKNKLRPSSVNKYGEMVFGDVIIKAGTQNIETLHDLYGVLDEYKSGDSMSLEVLRGKERKTIKVQLQ